MSLDTFNARGTLSTGSREYEIFRLKSLEDRFDLKTLPYSLKVLLENLLRHEDGVNVTSADIEAVAGWDPAAKPSTEIAYAPARVLMQDFTGVPAVVDLAAMRDAIASMGGDPSKINPLNPADLVIDHSVQVDFFGRSDAFKRNTELEFERNRERYTFLRWGQQALDNFRVVPPEMGIVHQVNLEYLAKVVWSNDSGQAYPDTLVGTDSHTTMVNGLGVLGWGVGGIEAEAVMLGQPISMLIPQVVGFKLTGALREGATATDLVLMVTEMLRETGVVGKFVEFYGPGLENLTLADRATLGNMSPEFGSTCAIFPVDQETLRYLRFTGREESEIDLVEAYSREQGMFLDYSEAVEPRFTAKLELDLDTVEPSIAGPKRPQDRVLLSQSKAKFEHTLADYQTASGSTSVPVTDPDSGAEFEIENGQVVVAAITSCTNTSNPSVMVAAGLLAKKAVERGLTSKPWVKTSLAPGSKVVSEYLDRSGLSESLDKLGFNLVGYGCTTCIGNSGPLPEAISKAINENDLAVCSVLSGNRNFEGRINADVKMNYLASPPLVVAYALAGTMDINLYTEPLGEDSAGNPVYMKDLWPTNEEIRSVVESSLESEMFRTSYSEVFAGEQSWSQLSVPEGSRFEWDSDSTYVQKPPYFEQMLQEPEPVQDIVGARVLALLGDSVTTDHISPAGAIKRDGPAGKFLSEHGVAPKDFNSFGSRRGNHEIMMRGTFANIRLRNLLAPGTEGGVTRHMPDGEEMSIYDAAMKYQQSSTPLVVLAGKEYGSGSSRDWAAKGTKLLGVRAVIAESYERIHRSNLVGMGVLPLQFLPGESPELLGLTGEEEFTIEGFADLVMRGEMPEQVRVVAGDHSFGAQVRIDTPKELEYYRHGGILQYVLRQLL